MQTFAVVSPDGLVAHVVTGQNVEFAPYEAHDLEAVVVSFKAAAFEFESSAPVLRTGPSPEEATMLTYLASLCALTTIIACLSAGFLLLGRESDRLALACAVAASGSMAVSSMAILVAVRCCLRGLL